MSDETFGEQKTISSTSYMHLVMLTLFLTFGLVFIYIPYYIAYIFPKNREIIYKIQSADKLFKGKEYSDALVNYIQLVNEYENFEYGIKQIALCSFALIDGSDDDDYFEFGMYFLRKLAILDEYLMRDIERYLPSTHKQQFKNLLK